MSKASMTYPIKERRQKFDLGDYDVLGLHKRQDDKLPGWHRWRDKASGSKSIPKLAYHPLIAAHGSRLDPIREALLTPVGGSFDLSTINSPPSDLADQAVAEASWIIDLPDDWDEAGASAYPRAVLDRVHRVLAILLDEAQLCGITTFAPDINPASSGGIDVSWDSADMSVLINVSSEPNGPITFYCEREDRLAAKGWILEK